MAWSPMVNLELDDEDRGALAEPIPFPMPKPARQYPYGCCISLTHAELRKLDLDVADASIGDIIDMRCFGVIKAISTNDGPDGKNCRVEIQIERMAIENEATETPDDDD